MKFGVTMFPTDYSIGPAELAKAVEERGFDMLLLPEHTHIPTNRRTPWPGGAELPREYSHTLDPFVALTAAAAVTDRLLIGTGICLVIERDPITLAKEVASLDFLSKGRFIFGIGGGWNEEEMENHGTDPARRWKLLRERVLAMKAVWTEDEAEFHGELVNFDSIWSWPKPAQKPHPPILVGGDGRHTLRRVVEYGDGWIPIPGRGKIPLIERMAELNRLAVEAGRGPIPVSLFGAQPRSELLSQYAETGVDRCIFWLPPAPASDVLPVLDRHAELAARFP
jgi:probable F420-dependent oxidoreductase